MKIAHPDSADKTESLVDMAFQLQQSVQQTAMAGDLLYETEKNILATVLEMGRLATDGFLQLHGDGDLGPAVETEDGVELQRSESLLRRSSRLQTNTKHVTVSICAQTNCLIVVVAVGYVRYGPASLARPFMGRFGTNFT